MAYYVENIYQATRGCYYIYRFLKFRDIILRHSKNSITLISIFSKPRKQLSTYLFTTKTVLHMNRTRTGESRWVLPRIFNLLICITSESFHDVSMWVYLTLIGLRLVRYLQHCKRMTVVTFCVLRWMKVSFYRFTVMHKRLIHRVQEKSSIFDLLDTTSANIEQFSKLFHWQILKEILEVPCCTVHRW